MTWIRIDPAQALIVGVKMLEAAVLGNQALDRLTALGGTGGLGAYTGTVQSELGASRASIVRNVQTWIDQGTDMLARTNDLLAKERAASMIGTVGSVSAAIIGGTVVGGVSAGAGFTQMSFPGYFAGSVVGGSGSGGALSGSLAIAGVVAKRQEATRAKLEALSRSGAGGGMSNSAAVQSIVNSQTIKQQWDLIGRIDASQALTLAPSGSRINSSGSTSSGYTSVGTYGSTRIETPTYRDRNGNAVP